ncbi:hypothetical protein JRQ81_016515, partial [Phrynocephalus forsythii]
MGVPSSSAILRSEASSYTHFSSKDILISYGKGKVIWLFWIVWSWCNWYELGLQHASEEEDLLLAAFKAAVHPNQRGLLVKIRSRLRRRQAVNAMKFKLNVDSFRVLLGYSNGRGIKYFFRKLTDAHLIKTNVCPS